MRTVLLLLGVATLAQSLYSLTRIYRAHREGGAKAVSSRVRLNSTLVSLVLSVALIVVVSLR
jgi:hypothetical protein